MNLQPSVPEKPIVSLATFGCDVVIEWNEPAASGFPILKYMVQIMLKNEKGELYPQNVENCEGRICTIPMKVLRSEPYNLELE